MSFWNPSETATQHIDSTSDRLLCRPGQFFFYGRSMGGFVRNSCYRMHRRRTVQLYANLANTLFARFYAKLLIPRLGT